MIRTIAVSVVLGAISLAVAGCSTDTSRACEIFKERQLKCAGSLNVALGGDNEKADIKTTERLADERSIHDRCKEDEALRERIHECNETINCEKFAACVVEVVPK